MASADLKFARETAKYASRLVYGIRREITDQEELFNLMNKQMILTALGNDTCLSELTAEEQQNLTSAIVLKS
jgi:hypothetical protein